MNEATLTIGQVAQRAGLNLSAIRYYEAKGLLPEAPRVSGQRRYGEETLARLGVIDVAKRAGFSLDDIRVLLDAGEAGEPAHERLRALAHRKLPEVDQLITRAERVRGWLQTATTCGCDSLDVCALFAEEDGLPPAGLHLTMMQPISLHGRLRRPAAERHQSLAPGEPRVERQERYRAPTRPGRSA